MSRGMCREDEELLAQSRKGAKKTEDMEKSCLQFLILQGAPDLYSIYCAYPFIHADSLRTALHPRRVVARPQPQRVCDR